MANPQEKKKIVIVGGGIIGATTAYYLTRHPKFDPALHTVILLEAAAIAAGASGKAGGLLALWAYPECLVPLSYRLHKELADEHDGVQKWGYRRVNCGTIGAVVKPADLERAVQQTQMEAVEDAKAEAESKASAKAPAAQPGMSALQASSTSTSAPQAEIGGTSLAVLEGNKPSETGTAASEAPEARPATANSGEKSNGSISNGTAETHPVKEEKDWEKLPKQDSAAVSLLETSTLPSDLDWIDSKLVQSYEQMGRRGFTETSQVHPFHFTAAIAELARSAGVDIRLGAKVTDIRSSPGDGGSSSSSSSSSSATDPGPPSLRIVEYQDRNDGDAVKTIENVTDVIITAGPWTGKLLPRSKIEGLRAHSIVYEAEVTPYAVFTDIQLPTDYVPEHRAKAGQKRRHKGNVDPEVYARPFGEVYACGEPDKTVPLPETADQVQADTAQCDDLAAYLATVSPTLAAAPIRARQACYLPQHVRFGTERGPLIGPTAAPRIWIASGHTCWGIQNGPATGYLMAQWLLDGEPTAADIDVLHPAKFKV
ncbi:FAD dependent oxidoreductase [Coniella lustricola]|uniref:FAD dependent oxidoreductase n=1 Tax=Coniella lustricola TaxID=2025994 RepID=A0A2T2ZWH2_9PEZI|nr:FAD dependent oxidoreductase [Coniella lustricola]